MGVSFKVAKAGTRYRPKPVQVEAKEIDSEPTFDCQRRGNEVYVHVNVFIYACIDISTLFVGKKNHVLIDMATCSRLQGCFCGFYVLFGVFIGCIVLAHVLIGQKQKLWASES